MKSIFLVLFALFSIEAFAAKPCNMFMTPAFEKKLMIVQFTTQPTSDLVVLHSMTGSCSSLVINLMAKLSHSVMFAGEEYANVMIYKNDSEDPMDEMLLSLEAYKEGWEVINFNDNSGIRVVPKEFADRVSP